MKFTTNSYSTSPEILKRKLGGELFASVTVNASAFTNGVCKAGTVLTATGTKATGADAIGILLNDVYEENPNGSLIKAFAVINEAVAKAHSGVEYSPEIKGALPNIIFE